jgi:hypothetical protein
MGEMRNTYKILTKELDGKIPLGRPRRRLEDNINIDLNERNVRMWIKFIWLRTDINGGIL